MSKESIQKITQAEQEARDILEAANQRARALYAETEQKSNDDREQVEKETEQRLRAMLDDMQKRSEEILSRSRESAVQDAEQMNKLAETHMEEAVKAIVWGIMEQCQ